MNEEVTKKVRHSQALVKKIRPLLAGQDPDVVGAALADLMAIFIASHICPGNAVETKKLRDVVFNLHIQTIIDLIPVNARILLDERRNLQ